MTHEDHPQRAGEEERVEAHEALQAQSPQSPPVAQEDPVEAAQAAADALAPRRRRKRRTRQMLPQEEAAQMRPTFTMEQRLLVLDVWTRSGLSAPAMAGLIGLSPHTLYGWRKRFAEQGPAGLSDRPRGRPKGSRLPEPTKRAIVMLKRQHPDWGSERISDVLRRADGFAASPGAIVRLLKQEGYEVVEEPTRPHPDKPRRFERARVNELWQSDLFSFTLKRSGRRLHLVAFLDDRSRYVVGWGLSASSSSKMVLEAFEAAIADYGAPCEVLTDQGPQYATWRGKSAFAKLCERRGIKHILARPRRPQTVGKTERFWGTLWRECLEGAVCRDLEDARSRVSHFVGHYNFQRPHRALDGLVPADRFFEAADAVKEALARRVAENALDLARHGTPRKPFYLTGRVGDREVSIFAEGERVVLAEAGGGREEVDLSAPGRRDVLERDTSSTTDTAPDPDTAASADPNVNIDPDPGANAPEPTTPSQSPSWAETPPPQCEPAPGTSRFDGLLRRLGRALGRPSPGEDDGEEPPREGGGTEAIR